LAGQDKVWGNFNQRFQDESSSMGPRMREHEGRGLASLVPEGNQVQIQRSGFVDDLLGLSTKVAFEILEFGQQGLGCFVPQRLKTGDGIHEGR